MTTRSSRHNRGFTLVELLVVIAIIALLISILLPAINKARRQAWWVACSSNQRQILLAITMYADSNKGYLPYFQVGGDPRSLAIGQYTGNASTGDFLYYRYEDGHGALWPYVGTHDPVTRQRLFVCPADPLPLAEGPDLLNPGLGTPKNFTYVFNPELSISPNWGGPFDPRGARPGSTKLSHIRGVDHKIFMIEPYYFSFVTFFIPPNLQYTPNPSPLAKLHSGRSNVGFGDGHVELFDPDSIINHGQTYVNGHMVMAPLYAYYFSLPHD